MGARRLAGPRPAALATALIAGLAFARMAAVGSQGPPVVGSPMVGPAQPPARSVAGLPRDCPVPVPPPADRAASTAAGWAGAWTTGQQPLPGPHLADRTLRLLVHPTLAGPAVRIRLANTFGAAPVWFAAVGVGTARRHDSPALHGRPVRVTFGGRSGVTLAAGARASSDPVRLRVRPGDTLAVDLYLPGPGPVPGSTGHARAVQLSFSAPGDAVGAGPGRFSRKLTAWYWLDGVDVQAGPGAGSVVAIGDSLTDGTYSTLGANHRWPDRLAERLRASGSRLGVLNVGIGGNRVTKVNAGCRSPSASALSRFDRDVLGQSGVRVVIVAEGINDLATGTSAGAVIDGLARLAAAGQARGLPVVGATVMPYGCPSGCLRPAQEAARQQVNSWIRTSGTFAAVADFDRAARDPEHPDRLLPGYDLGDHLHLDDAGYAAMAAAVPLPLPLPLP